MRHDSMSYFVMLTTLEIILVLSILGCLIEAIGLKSRKAYSVKWSDKRCSLRHCPADFISSFLLKTIIVPKSMSRFVRTLSMVVF